jgi:hypothetical protein
MANKLIGFLVIFGLLGFAFKNCVKTTSPKGAAFTGTFLQTSENGITGGKDIASLVVATDGVQFRITKRVSNPDDLYAYETISVFDGKNFSSKSHTTFTGSQQVTEDNNAEEESDEEGDSAEPTAPAEPEGQSEQKPMSREEAEFMMFWKTVETKAMEAGPGGTVCGRNTMLYQVRENQPDRTVTVRRWVDQENKILLKSEFSIFAKQVDSLLAKESYECLQIQLGAPDPSAFQHP